jgi:hypothetical protein
MQASTVQTSTVVQKCITQHCALHGSSTAALTQNRWFTLEHQESLFCSACSLPPQSQVGWVLQPPSSSLDSCKHRYVGRNGLSGKHCAQATTIEQSHHALSAHSC